MNNNTSPMLMLECQNLSVAFESLGKITPVVKNFNLKINKGQTHGIVGESGCGKSTLAYSIMQYLGKNGKITSGNIYLNGENILAASKKRLHEIRGNDIAMIYQEQMSALNPSMRIINQLAEIPLVHTNISKQEAFELSYQMLEKVKIPDIKRISSAYPHQLSGGQLQRIIIAMALIMSPKLLILDEPTTALDVTIEAGIIDLIRDYSQNNKMTMLFISHNLGLIREVCDSMTIMYAGREIEIGTTKNLFTNMRHPYSKSLLASIPSPVASKKGVQLNSIQGSSPMAKDFKNIGCDFAPRCIFYKKNKCSNQIISLTSLSKLHQVRCSRINDFIWKIPKNSTIDIVKPEESIVIKYSNVNKTYEENNHWFVKKKYIYANKNINLQTYRSEILAIVGESGCGKTTLAKMLVGLETVTKGSITLFDEQVGNVKLSKRRTDQKANIQFIFQNSFDSLNPSQTVGKQLKHIIRLANDSYQSRKTHETMLKLLLSVKLHPEIASKYPSQLSGGQKQRVAITRAYALSPKIIIADEPVSALDVSVQAAVMELLLKLQLKNKSSLILISHDLGVVKYLADRIMVMYLGQIVEEGLTENIFSAPYHPYTEALISAIPLADSNIKKRKVLLDGTLPKLPGNFIGCPFYSRCPYAIDNICKNEKPPTHIFNGNHKIYCHKTRNNLLEMLPIFSNLKKLSK